MLSGPLEMGCAVLWTISNRECIFGLRDVVCREDAVSEAVGSSVPILLTLVKHLFLAPSLCSILMLFIKIHFCFFGHILLCNPSSTMLHFCFLLFLNDSLAFTQHVANTVYNFLSILMPTLHPHSVWTKKSWFLLLKNLFLFPTTPDAHKRKNKDS